MGNKSPALVKAENKITSLESTNARMTDLIQGHRESMRQKDMIINDIHAAEKRLIAELAEANARIDELEGDRVTQHFYVASADKAIQTLELKMQRILGWIDGCDNQMPGHTKFVESEDTDDED